jgi:hypothetical protein
MPAPAPTATISSTPPTNVIPANQLVTLTGGTYNNAHVEKVVPDGIYISYTPRGGGIAITKIYNNELSDEMRQRYGSNSANQ